jgi:hypothetical protein
MNKMALVKCNNSKSSCPQCCPHKFEHEPIGIPDDTPCDKSSTPCGFFHPLASCRCIPVRNYAVNDDIENEEDVDFGDEGDDDEYIDTSTED